MSRFFPAPLLSLVLAVLWLVLWDEHGLTVWAGAALVGVGVPLLTAGLRPTRPHARRPWVALKLLLRVARDSFMSALDVARLLLTRRAQDIPSKFVRVPLILQDSHALATLAVVISAVPGTALAELASDRSALLIHVLASTDEAELLDNIRRHYEEPLSEIFET